MNSHSRFSVIFCAIAAAVITGGCATGPKNLEPVNTPPPKSQLLKGLDIVQQPELEPDWADFVKQHYPLWRQHYWVDRGQWGNRGYIVGAPPTNIAPAEVQLTPAPAAVAPPTPPTPPPPAITPITPTAPPTIVETPAPKMETPEKQTTYTVKKGDSLWRIAGRVYGNPFKWPRIYKANKDKIKNANKIQPGQVLVSPQD